MKKVSLSIVTAFVFLLAMAVAQDTTGNTGSAGSSGTEQSSPSMSQGSSGSQTGSQGGSMGSDTGSMKHDKGMKGEKTLKGCVRSEGGNYMLEEKSGKTVNLSGSDMSAHVGHEVKVMGMYGGGSSDSSAASSSGSSMGAGHTFNVTNVTMVSETCSMGKKSKGSMGGNSGGGSTTQPPQ
jgi:hypothetical protein